MTELPFMATDALVLVGKATLVLCVAFGLAYLGRRGSAKSLHLLWIATFVVLLLLPVLILLTPSWALPILPARTVSVENARTVLQTNDLASSRNAPAVGHESVPMDQDLNGLAHSPKRPWGSIPLSAAAGLFLIWGIGCAAGLISLAIAAFRFRTLVRAATPIRSQDWAHASARLRRQLGVRTNPRLLTSSRVDSPMTGGPLRPVVLLPISAMDWNSGRREMVLSHELVHVRRRDALWRLISGIVVAVYWYHPLVWLASRFAVSARESSCDEEVLALDVRPSEYARHLFELAAEVSTDHRGVLSLPVVQRPHLENRIMSILKQKRPSYSRFRAYSTVCVVGFVGMVAACASSVRTNLTTVPAPQAEQSAPDVRPAERLGASAVSVRAPDRVSPPPSEAAVDFPGTTPISQSGLLDIDLASGFVVDLPGVTPISLSRVALKTMESSEIECGQPGSGWSGIKRERGATTFQMSVEGMTLCMHTRGDVELSADRTTVQSMTSGSSMILQSEAELVHRLTISSAPSGLDYNWNIDGNSQPFDEDAREWRDLMLRVMARYSEASEVRIREGELRREIGSHQRHVGSLRRQIGSLERHAASLHRQVAALERKKRRSMSWERARLQSTVAMQGALNSISQALEQLDLAELEELSHAFNEDNDVVRRDTVLNNDVRQTVEDVRRIQEEAGTEVFKQMIDLHVEIVRVNEKLLALHKDIAEFDQDNPAGDVSEEIEQHNHDRKIQDIEAEIEQYDLDGKVRSLEREILEWDADSRVSEIERQAESDVAALRDLIQILKPKG